MLTPPVLTFLMVTLLGVCMVALATVSPWVVLGVNWYLLGPLKNRREKRFPANRELIEVRPESHSPDEARTHANAGRQLRRVGFSLVAFARPVETAKSVDASMSLWLHPVEKVAAVVIAVGVERPDHPGKSTDVCGFHTEFADGALVGTSNAGRAVFRPNPAEDEVRWPGMFDLSVLHRLHVARVARARGGREVKLPPPEQALARVRENEHAVLLRQAQAGYMWFDPSCDAFRLTLKGALFMRWKMLWPWRDWLAAQYERKLRRVLREVGMGMPEDYSPHPKDADAPPGLSYASATTE